MLPRKIDHALLVRDEESGSERRHHERFDLLVQVTLLHTERSGTLTVLNISAGGVLLRNDHDDAFAVGEPIRVQFDIPDVATFSIEAKIIRILTPAGKPTALAAMWTSSDATASAGLGEVLWSLSGRR